MERNTNALAELAETLKNGYVSLVVNDRQVATFATAAFPELDKAARIVAELAKVEQPIQLARGSGKTFTHLYEFLEANNNRAVEIVRNCRIIAMEVAGDGK